MVRVVKSRLDAVAARAAGVLSLVIGVSVAAGQSPVPPATETSREHALKAEIVAKWTTPGGTADERGTPLPLYSNLEFASGGAFQNGGASGTGAAAITRLVADDVTMTAPGPLASGFVAVRCSAPAPVTARPRLRLYQNNGPGGGPGTLLFSATLSTVTFNAGGAVSLLSISFPGTSVPQQFWAGLTFDAGGAGMATATLAELNTLGVERYSPPFIGSSTASTFRTTAAGSFAGNTPGGTITQSGSLGWEFSPVSGACCYLGTICSVKPEIECLNSGGAYLGDNTNCSECGALDPFNSPPPPGRRYLLDQITSMDFDSLSIQKLSSQQYAQPPSTSPLNTAVIDEFTLSAKTVVTGVDAVTSVSGAGAELPPPGGYLLSIWPSVSAAQVDATLQGNTLYNQGYTVPLVFRGGGEYDPFPAFINSNAQLLTGVKLFVDPSISAEAGERGTGGGLVLNAGTYYFAVIHRAPQGWGSGLIASSTHQDPRFPANNGVQVNPLGGQFPGQVRNINAPAAYRVTGRNCFADLNGDGSVNTIDLTRLLAQFGQGVPANTGADLNADGVVNTADLIELLGAFGQLCH